MILLIKLIQIFINTICIITLISMDNIIDMQVIFGITLLISSSISIATIFYEKSKKNDKVMCVLNTFFIFMVAQIYTAITGIFISKDLFDHIYKAICFCLNAIMMGVAFDAFKKYNEKN